ncbi:hypothetical protein BDF20DRAFT_834915 [Mycotypha africana]|uniref:uncharacterized protein n=1 Tax=Mycotypha africana TaxID=64632 RepID=UPI0023007973|nr:uncharacterized protein BDF20DRAFT_834915 [Mycotypha africana]KAI8982279.1 hypothetical protein BDF20DRAFT_834915 [Mycotypha africana]
MTVFFEPTIVINSKLEENNDNPYEDTGIAIDNSVTILSSTPSISPSKTRSNSSLSPTEYHTYFVEKNKDWQERYQKKTLNANHEQANEASNYQQKTDQRVDDVSTSSALMLVADDNLENKEQESNKQTLIIEENGSEYCNDNINAINYDCRDYNNSNNRFVGWKACFSPRRTTDRLTSNRCMGPELQTGEERYYKILQCYCRERERTNEQKEKRTRKLWLTGNNVRRKKQFIVILMIFIGIFVGGVIYILAGIGKAKLKSLLKNNNNSVVGTSFLTAATKTAENKGSHTSMFGLNPWITNTTATSIATISASASEKPVIKWWQ